MTFAAYTLANGEPTNIVVEYVCAVKQLPGNTQARIWSISPSKPGASDGYVTVQGSFIAVLTPLSIIPLQVFNETGTGVKIAINAAFTTRIEGLPGNTACRVSWASNGAAGYAIVDGDIATVSAALAFNPPGPVPAQVSVTARVQFTAILPVFTQLAAVYVASPLTGPVSIIDCAFDSVNPATLGAQLRKWGGVTVGCTWQETVAVNGERVIAGTLTGSSLGAGWWALEARLLSGTDGGCFGCFLQQ